MRVKTNAQARGAAMAYTEVVLASFLLIALASVLIAKRIRTPYTTLLVLMGLVLAAIPVAGLSGLTGFFENLANEQLFVGLVLPPILFESVMSIKAADFKAVYRPAFVMATAGVLISVLVVGVVLWKVVGLSPLVSFLFAALISPTDVATVLEVFARVNVPPKLAALVEMESVFNDPTGIAVFTVVLTSSAAAALEPVRALATFTYILTGGILVGLGVSWGARRVQSIVTDAVTQVVLTLVAVYGSFALASAIGASGLIAVAVTGVFYGNAVITNMESRKLGDVTREFWTIISFVANAAAFFFIGVSTNIFLLATSLGAFLVAYAVVIMARITSVYPLLSIMRVEGRETPSSWMNVSTLGGMRGALAIALVSAVPLATRQPVATLTFGVVMLSILLQGPLLGRYANRVFGHQETLQTGESDEEAADKVPARTPAEPLSPEPEEQGDDELR